MFAKKFKNTKIFQPIRVNTCDTQVINTVRYLRVHLNNRLTFRNHIKQTLRKAYAVNRKLYPLMVKNSALSIHNKLLIYKMIIRPIMLYAAPIWCSVAPTTIKSLQIFQNKCLRLALSEDRYARVSSMHDRANIPPIADYVKKLSKKFYKEGLGNNVLTRDLTKLRKHI